MHIPCSEGFSNELSLLRLGTPEKWTRGVASLFDINCPIRIFFYQRLIIRSNSGWFFHPSIFGNWVIGNQYYITVLIQRMQFLGHALGKTKQCRGEAYREIGPFLF